jgi:hypothetical protein
MCTAATERIFMEFDTGDFIQRCRENPNFVKMGQKYEARYMKAKVLFVAGNIKSTGKRAFRGKWYQAVRITEGV